MKMAGVAPFQMAVYASGDKVSEMLRQLHNWESRFPPRPFNVLLLRALWSLLDGI